ncbi:predicted protein [Scheffersomyces stipitis CBS 6054]|uniref:Uncharacterized protein n=1 Tax=Scheffersomyces stipitis (strain ATCC 58785 / CBS 6054 / NBRC 10063 / NRRL Y-11545) TaxID=322104 RepID=A3LSH8_PICST|nr:predicted protein [Scheffersomyces stipitis CBS 6054]ABN65569.1 predicted protein [Scheffersomyces stipitis CBS 6054]KAG2733836.1 hypothetical protein G9P44_003361 [Scheffersomyces stipitis]
MRFSTFTILVALVFGVAATPIKVDNDEVLAERNLKYFKFPKFKPSSYTNKSHVEIIINKREAPLKPLATKTDPSHINLHYQHYLNEFDDLQQAVVFAKSVSSDIRMALATPTYNAKMLLRSIYQNVPEPTENYFNEIIEDQKNARPIVDSLLGGIIEPFLQH